MQQFNAFHGFSERPRCPQCSSPICERIPSVGFSVSGVSKEKQREKVGQKVEEFIEKSKDELKQQKEELGDKR
tara:strand:+ start:15851 stop:16069 length:219 start_codon:yes stop_codon:yes gene_type:complete